MLQIDEDSDKFWTLEKQRLYKNAMTEVIRQIETIEYEIYKKSGNHIIRYKENRLKSNDSIYEKLKRKGKCCGNVNIEKAINDLAGVRVICYDTRQVYLLVKEIRKLKKFKIIKEKDYISHPKENGYQSYHMILEFLNVKIELQIRTILMDAWSSLETVLIYKKIDRPPANVIEKIQKFSKWSKKMDHMVEEMLKMKDDENGV